ncbi:hypothetical protein BH11ACT8_BH11ACT8_26870 [soil metagenome]
MSHDDDTVAADETPPAPRARHRRHWSFWLGLGLIGTGLALLGHLGWQLYGTDVVSHRRHTETVQRLEQQWDDESGQATVRTDHGTAGAIMRVPRFGADYAVPVLEGVGEEQLASGMGHVVDSAPAGGVGNYAVAGHRITHGEPLRALPDLEPGDEIVIETRTTIFHYVLDTGGSELRVPFSAAWVLAPEPVNPDGGVGPAAGQTRLITLSTCAELFHTDDRLVAFGHLESVERR